jgi:hypothetical protein
VLGSSNLLDSLIARGSLWIWNEAGQLPNHAWHIIIRRSLLLYITSQMQWDHMFMLNSESPLQWQTKCENWINRWLYSIVLLSAI